MNAHLDLLLGRAYHGALAPDHLADLRKSGLTDETIALHKIRTVPPGMIDHLLGFHAPHVKSAYIIPFPDPQGAWLDHVKLKVFSDEGEFADVRGDHVVVETRERWRYNGGRRKYLVRRRSAPRLYVPIPTMRRVLEGDEPVFVIEGMKKALLVAQCGLPAVAIESAWGWHVKGSRALLPDFAALRLTDRIVEVVPDSDVQTNPMIEKSIRRLADALRATGARPRLVQLPAVDGHAKVGIDDYLMMSPGSLMK